MSFSFSWGQGIVPIASCPTSYGEETTARLSIPPLVPDEALLLSSISLVFVTIL